MPLCNESINCIITEKSIKVILIGFFLRKILKMYQNDINKTKKVLGI